MVFVRYPFPCGVKIMNFGAIAVNAEQIENDIESYLGFNQFSLFYNGRRLHGSEVIPDSSTVHVTFTLPGGKGGFGSMLRAIGAQIEKTTNREACRDLSGRRLRDINEEQRLKKWIAKEAEREAEKVKRRQARIERLKTKAPHNFFDFEYEKKISELPDRIDEALNEGLQKVKEPKKRPYENPKETKLPKKSWLVDDLPITSSDSDSDETKGETESGPSKKLKMIQKESSGCDTDMSESSLSCPGSSKDSHFIPKESTSSNSKSAFLEEKGGENSADSDKMDVVQQEEDKIVPSSKNTPIEQNKAENTKGKASSEKNSKSVLESSYCTSAEEPDTKDDSPIDLLDFESISELEALGLDTLKSALMIRGLKCGGNLSDRAQRLWKVRGLMPHQYPANLLAKNKK